MEKRKITQIVGFGMLVLFLIGFMVSLMHPFETAWISSKVKFIGVSCYVIVMSLFLAYPLRLKK